MERRSFLAFLGLAPLAPALVRSAVALPVLDAIDSGAVVSAGGNKLLTTTEITREALSILHEKLAFQISSTNCFVPSNVEKMTTRVGAR